VGQPFAVLGAQVEKIRVRGNAKGRSFQGKIPKVHGTSERQPAKFSNAILAGREFA
jgi:ribosomal protein L35AE/L33A